MARWGWGCWAKAVHAVITPNNEMNHQWIRRAVIGEHHRAKCTNAGARSRKFCGAIRAEVALMRTTKLTAVLVLLLVAIGCRDASRLTPPPTPLERAQKAVRQMGLFVGRDSFEVFERGDMEADLRRFWTNMETIRIFEARHASDVKVIVNPPFAVLGSRLIAFRDGAEEVYPLGRSAATEGLCALLANSRVRGEIATEVQAIAECCYLLQTGYRLQTHYFEEELESRVYLGFRLVGRPPVAAAAETVGWMRSFHRQKLTHAPHARTSKEGPVAVFPIAGPRLNEVHEFERPTLDYVEVYPFDKCCRIESSAALRP